MIEDSYCQGPKPRESESCASRRRRRENDADGKQPFFARPSLLTRQNDFIKVARDPAEAASRHDAGDRCGRDELSWAERENTSSPSRSIDAGRVNALPDTRTGLIPSNDSGNPTRSREDRPQLDKRSGSAVREVDDEREVSASEIKKGEVVVDKEDIRNLTLTIVLERDDRNIVTNFPKGFEPQPPANGTEFVLRGMDALRYIQRIQEEARAS